MENLSAEDQAVVDRLRSKYADAAAAASSTEEGALDASIAASAQAMIPASSGGKGSNVDARMCGQCQGQGKVVEIYNHRRLERYCETCEGRGVTVYKNGVEVREGAGGGARGSAAAGSGQASASGMAGPDGPEVVAERIAKLQADLQQITKKLAGYTQERLELRASLQPQPGAASAPGGGGDPGRAQAVQDVCAQLELQMERLELLRRKKAAQLEAYQAMAAPRQPDEGLTEQAARITIDDIIANEGA